jgi:hypothetical protein
MRVLSLLIVVVIVVSVISTGSPFLSFGHAGEVSIQQLDVCHSSTPVVNPELPYISACPCCPIRPQVAGVSEPYEMKLIPLVLVFPDEQPPKA